MSASALSWMAVGVAGVAAVVQPFAPLWLCIGLILVSMSLSAVVLVVTRRRWRRLQLEAQMAAAFGTRGGPS